MERSWGVCRILVKNQQFHLLKPLQAAATWNENIILLLLKTVSDLFPLFCFEIFTIIIFIWDLILFTSLSPIMSSIGVTLLATYKNSFSICILIFLATFGIFLCITDIWSRFWSCMFSNKIEAKRLVGSLCNLNVPWILTPWVQAMMNVAVAPLKNNTMLHNINKQFCACISLSFWICSQPKSNTNCSLTHVDGCLWLYKKFLLLYAPLQASSKQDKKRTNHMLSKGSKSLRPWERHSKAT